MAVVRVVKAAMAWRARLTAAASKLCSNVMLVSSNSNAFEEVALKHVGFAPLFNEYKGEIIHMEWRKLVSHYQLGARDNKKSDSFWQQAADHSVLNFE